MPRPSDTDARKPSTRPTRAARADVKRERLDAALDEALDETFPASDPIAVHGADAPQPEGALPMRTTPTVTKERAELATPTDLGATDSQDIAAALNGALADVFALYLKTKNFHWHVSGPHFRDYHLLFDEQADQIFAMVDPLAERVRKVGAVTIRSIAHIARIQRISDNDATYVDPLDMLAELREDNLTLTRRLREAHFVCDEHRDVASASLLETWIDEAEKRTWFLYETARRGDRMGH